MFIPSSSDRIKKREKRKRKRKEKEKAWPPFRDLQSRPLFFLAVFVSLLSFSFPLCVQTWDPFLNVSISTLSFCLLNCSTIFCYPFVVFPFVFLFIRFSFTLLPFLYFWILGRTLLSESICFLFVCLCVPKVWSCAFLFFFARFWCFKVSLEMINLNVVLKCRF